MVSSSSPLKFYCMTKQILCLKMKKHLSMDKEYPIIKSLFNYCQSVKEILCCGSSQMGKNT